MLSVSLRKSFYILFLLFLIFGCLGTDKSKKDRGDPIILIDAASVKVSAANQYLMEDEEDKALEVLKDAHGDLIVLISILNNSKNNEGVNTIKKAERDVEATLTFVKEGDFESARLSLKILEEELLTAGVLMLGETDALGPTRFEVYTREMPLTYYGSVDGIYLGYQIVPHNIAAAARESFYRYQQAKEEEDLKRGVFLSDYLISTATPSENGKFVVWENNFEWPPYKLSKGWIGSLSQAGCIKALMLAYLATEEEGYREVTEMALEAFYVDVSEGGLRILRSDETGDYVWYPEYASADPPYVLNGFITSVIWLGDYYSATGNSKAKELYEEGLRSVKHFLPSYDETEQWSFYDARGHRANSHYHDLHVKQMTLLYELTGEEVFKDYEEKWGGGFAGPK
jgi:hypothetical protein